MTDSVLEVRHLTKRYPSFVLDDVSFRLDAGHIMGLVGRNGAGKSTTLKAILGIVHPDDGEVRFFGEDYRSRQYQVMKRVAFSMGEVAFYPKKRLRMIADVYKRFFDRWEEPAYRSYLERFELVEDKTIDELSAGMKVKFGLALALSRHAELVLLDEPTSGLDPLSRDDLLRALRGLVEDKGVSLLFSTHQMSDLEQVADDITYLERGKVRASEPLANFVSSYSMVSGPSDALTPQLSGALIGATYHQGRVEALIESSRAAEAGSLVATPASLNDIVVHLERQENQR